MATQKSSSPLQEVRGLQKLGRKLRKMFLPISDVRKVSLNAIQFANDCTMCNPPKGSDAAAQERWATRWLARYNLVVGQKLASSYPTSGLKK